MSEFSPDLRYRDDAVRIETVRQITRYVRLVLPGQVERLDRRKIGPHARLVMLAALRVVADRIENGAWDRCSPNFCSALDASALSVATPAEAPAAPGAPQPANTSRPEGS